MKEYAMLITSQRQYTELKAKFFRGFADPSRLSILDSLSFGPLSVSEIVSATGLSQSNVSNHLSCLRDCGLVVFEQQGRFVRYKISDERVRQLLSLADVLVTEVAKGI
jgi:ArsR family transcriptional regulator, cadmium/lead-responsive transcriptional repressor